jgi:predicted phage tail protein
MFDLLPLNLYELLSALTLIVLLRSHICSLLLLIALCHHYLLIHLLFPRYLALIAHTLVFHVQKIQAARTKVYYFLYFNKMKNIDRVELYEPPILVKSKNDTEEIAEIAKKIFKAEANFNNNLVKPLKLKEKITNIELAEYYKKRKELVDFVNKSMENIRKIKEKIKIEEEKKQKKQFPVWFVEKIKEEDKKKDKAEPIEKVKDVKKETIKRGKLVKGSKEAKEYMAKIRKIGCQKEASS